jgi:hypothetical protein
MTLRIKKRSDGRFDLGENVRVPGKKTPRFKAILHLGKNPTIDAAIEAQRRDRCDPRRSGETQIGAESRRAKAKLIIDQLQTMKLRATGAAEKMAREMVTKTVMQKMKSGKRTSLQPNGRPINSTTRPDSGTPQTPTQFSGRPGDAEQMRREMVRSASTTDDQQKVTERYKARGHQLQCRLLWADKMLTRAGGQKVLKLRLNYIMDRTRSEMNNRRIR